MKKCLSLILGLIAGMAVVACGNGAHMQLPEVNNNQKGSGAPPSPNPTPTLGPFYTTEMRPLFVKRCSTCHNPTSGHPNWMIYSVAYERRDRIRERILIKRDMPMGGRLDESELDLFRRWLDAGAPEGPPVDEPTPSPSPSPTPSPEPSPSPTPVPSPSPSPSPTPSPGPSPTPPNNPGPGGVVTFKDDFLPLIKARCALCHGVIPGIPDWRSYPVAAAKKDRIMQRVVVEKTMPPKNPLSPEQIQLVKAWVEGGALYEKPALEFWSPQPPPTTSYFAQHVRGIFDQKCPPWSVYQAALAARPRIYFELLIRRTTPRECNPEVQFTGGELGVIQRWIEGDSLP